ncbi:DEAD/DEAH box helicase [Phanerochaete sordida]|uniref:DEAD/DEAH box helicase n=1 Tax=Phanerochaete sordida TaxID=48140 RepID=A0A9P3G3R7_9APHY|nr:DEAD/DEAH box helicase [Phanerochaete sordida]
MEALEAGSTRIGVSLPTGSGKTTVFITLLSRIKPSTEYPDATRSLVIVNNIELARQSAKQAQMLFPGWSVEIEQGQKHKASGKADLTVATYQTLSQGQRLEKFDPSYLKAVIVDEAHHAAAPSYRTILSRFHPEIQAPTGRGPATSPARHVPIFGFSATFSRHDGLALGSVFERIVYHRDFLEMIKEQWLCDVRFTSVKANIDLSNVTVNSANGDFSATSLAQVINTPTVNRLVVQSWLEKAAGRKSTLVFCVNLHHLRELTNTFRAAGVNAAYIHAGTPTAERKALISAFKGGEFPVLLNVAILTEGTDIPNIDCVLVARPTRSRNLFAQMIGRGMRLSPGKTDCHIIDFVDSSTRVAGVVSVPTLFGLDPAGLIDNASLESLEEKAISVIPDFDLEDVASEPDTLDDVPEPKSVTYTDYNDPFSFVAQSHGAPHIQQLSRFSWVGCGGDVYVLECMGKGHIRVEPVQDENDPEVHYQAHFTPPTMTPQTAALLKISPFQRSRKVLSARTLQDAIQGCDNYAKSNLLKGPLVAGLLRSAKWRRAPATDSQKKWVAQRWAKFRSDPSEVDGKQPAKLATLTKGEAANIITRLKHGAASRYQKQVKAVAKKAAVADKERKRMAREHVRVGPLPVPLAA